LADVSKINFKLSEAYKANIHMRDSITIRISNEKMVMSREGLLNFCEQKTKFYESEIAKLEDTLRYYKK
jgi:hypothetical protein